MASEKNKTPPADLHDQSEIWRRHYKDVDICIESSFVTEAHNCKHQCQWNAKSTLLKPAPVCCGRKSTKGFSLPIIGRPTLLMSRAGFHAHFEKEPDKHVNLWTRVNTREVLLAQVQLHVGFGCREARSALRKFSSLVPKRHLSKHHPLECI